jgi:hypothetical protein
MALRLCLPGLKKGRAMNGSAHTPLTTGYIFQIREWAVSFSSDNILWSAAGTSSTAWRQIVLINKQ